MSQVALTNEERTVALQAFGYTDREAAFLCMAALHGGYFLRRQYGQFLGRQDGGTTSQFVEKVLSKGHARVFTYRPKTYLYHLDRRPFYAALGQPDNRNRRLCQPATIKNKLMGFDFVLTLPGMHFLGTEQEKLDYFLGALGIDRNAFPVKLYGSENGRAQTRRYFVDKYPLFLSGGADTHPVVSFSFVDEGAATVSAFETHLGQYSRLFAALGRFHLVYVAASRARFAPAERVFERFLARSWSAGSPEISPERLRMLEYFKVRQRYEAKQMDGFDRAKLIQLRNDREAFGGVETEALYERWKASGERAIQQNLLPNPAVPARYQPTFSTCHLEHDFDLFGSVTSH